MNFSQKISVFKKSAISKFTVTWLRFGTAWAGIAGLWGMTNVCPCCGQPVCPINSLISLVIGFLGASFFYALRNWGNFIRSIKSRAIIRDKVE